jgi:hypothetical protein
MKKNLKYLGILFAILTISSCCNQNAEIEKLKAENADLRSKISTGEKAQPGNYYEAIVVPNSNFLKSGNEYNAAIYLSVSEKNNPAKAVIGELDMEGKLVSNGDTLLFEKNHFLYKDTPKTTGKHKFSGAIIKNINGKEKLFPFTAEYNVIN